MKEKQKKILQATMECVAEYGLQRSTTAEIARLANVGEGTLYRYFSSKDDLFEQTAFFAGQMISERLVETFVSTDAIHIQYVKVCQTFLKSGLHYPVPYQFLEQFRNSPQGTQFKKTRISEVVNQQMERPFFYPLNTILHRAKDTGVVKNYPFQVLASLTIGPLLFILKDACEGLLHLDDYLISDIAEACWDSISR